MHRYRQLHFSTVKEIFRLGTYRNVGWTSLVLVGYIDVGYGQISVDTRVRVMSADTSLRVHRSLVTGVESTLLTGVSTIRQ